jgi:hypothetical protein
MFARYRTTVISPIKTKTPSQQSWTSGHPLQLTWHRDRPKQNTVGPIRAIRHHIDAVMNAIAHVHIKPPRLTKQRFIAWGTAAEAMAGRLLLRIRLRFHNHTPQQRSIRLPFHQPAAHQVWSDQFSCTGEE